MGAIGLWVLTGILSSVWAAQERYVREQVLLVSWGTSKEELGLIEAEGEEPYGPEALAVSGDRLYILDGANRRIQQYDTEGRHLASLKMEIAGQAMDATPDGILYVLDPFGSVIAVYDRDGALRGTYRYDMPKALDKETLPISRIIVSRGGEVLLGTYRDVYPVTLKPSPSKVGRLRKGIPSDDQEKRVVIAGGDEHRAYLLIEDRSGKTIQRTAVDTEDPLASLTFVKTDRSGHLYTIVETFDPRDEETIRIRREVRKYDREGKLLARMELALGYTYCPGGDVDVDPEGTIYHLLTMPSGAKVIRWRK